MTPSRVVSELKDLRGKARLEVLISQGLIISDPGEEAISAVIAASKKSGDTGVLSQTDIDVLALAYEVHGAIYTDDFALQNTARHLEITINPILQRKSQAKVWKLRCIGCGRYYETIPVDSLCEVCGSQVKRKIK